MKIKRYLFLLLVTSPLVLGSSISSAANIIETAVAAGQFNTLVAAVKAADLVSVLEGDGPFTVFAPIDEAFAKLPEGTVANLLKEENRDQLISILTYHIVPSKLTSADITGQELELITVQGSILSIHSQMFDSVMVGVKINEAESLTLDVETSNGVIHVIDSVLIPN